MKGYLIQYSSGEYDDYTGEYDDYRTYEVKVFLDKKLAEFYKEKWNRIYLKLEAFYSLKHHEDENDDEWWYKIYNIRSYWNPCCIVEIEVI